VCTLCERGPCAESERWCSAENEADAAVLGRLAVELRDRSTWTQQSWELLRTHLGRVPAARLMAAVGASKTAASPWNAGRKRARPWQWAAPAAAGRLRRPELGLLREKIPIPAPGVPFPFG
jgi:hypothetical protein